MKKNIKSLAFVLLFFSVFLTTSSSAGAAIMDGINSGTTDLNDLMKVVLNVAKWILGISGSAALLMFVYGGVTFLISAGSSDKVKKAKDIIIGSVIGLIIVFASYTIIGFVMKSMGLSETGWASSNWFK